MTIWDSSLGPMRQAMSLFGTPATLYHILSSGYDASGDAYNNKVATPVTVILEPVTDVYTGDNIIGRHDLGDFNCYFDNTVTVADGDYLSVLSKYYAVFALRTAEVSGMVYQECSLKKVEGIPL